MAARERMRDFMVVSVDGWPCREGLSRTAEVSIYILVHSPTFTSHPRQKSFHTRHAHFIYPPICEHATPDPPRVSVVLHSLPPKVSKRTSPTQFPPCYRWIKVKTTPTVLQPHPRNILASSHKKQSKKKIDGEKWRLRCVDWSAHPWPVLETHDPGG